MASGKDIFSGNGGRVQSAIEIHDLMRSPPSCEVLVDGVSVNDQIWLLTVEGGGEVNVQFDVNFDNALFVTVFGDKMTALSFRGLVVPATCGGGSGTGLVKFYAKYKVGAQSKAPIFTVTYTGGFVFKGVLTAMQMNPYSQSGVDAFTFTMTIFGRVMTDAVL